MEFKRWLGFSAAEPSERAAYIKLIRLRFAAARQARWIERSGVAASPYRTNFGSVVRGAPADRQVQCH